MFPQLKKINNESGMVLFIVLLTAIIIMVMSLGILTQSMNEINYAQQQIDQLTSEQWSKGVWWNAYSSGNFSVGIGTTTMNGRIYSINIIPGSTVNGITSYNIVTNYNTF